MKRAELTRDYDLRAAVVRKLMAEGVERGNIRHEITLDTSSSGGRLDILVLTHSLLAIEIKSGADKVDGLADQVESYKRATDQILAVIDATQHGLATEQAYWHGCDVHYFHAPTNEFVELWRGEMRPHPTRLLPSLWGKSRVTSTFDVARLLWAPEVSDVCKKLGGGGSTRERGLQWLRENATLKSVRPLVIETLRARQLNLWEEAFWKTFDEKEAKAA